MRRRLAAAFLCALAAATLSGCSTVTIAEPPGVVVGDEIGRRLEGVWAVRNEAWHVKYLGEGQLRVALVAWSDEMNQFRVREYDISLRMLGDAMFMATEDLTSPINRPRHFFARVTLTEDGDLVVYWPRVDAFARAVLSEDVAGIVSAGENYKRVELHAAKAEQDHFLTSNADRFDWDSPMVLRRVADLSELALATMETEPPPAEAPD